jgi:hypothetical protein
MGCGFQSAVGELEDHMKVCVYEGMKGFLAKYEEEKANFSRHLREQRIENFALRDTVVQLSARVEELSALLEAKTCTPATLLLSPPPPCTVHYDSVLRHLTDAQQVASSRSGVAVRPPLQAALVRAVPPSEGTLHTSCFSCFSI